jgi:hypothetical protein
MNRTYKAVQLKNRNDIFTLRKGDKVSHRGFEVEVEEIICAQGGDMCVSGSVTSWTQSHNVNVNFNDKVFWGPKGVARDLNGYLAGKFFGKKI